MTLDDYVTEYRLKMARAGIKDNDLAVGLALVEALTDDQFLALAAWPKGGKMYFNYRKKHYRLHRSGFLYSDGEMGHMWHLHKKTLWGWGLGRYICNHELWQRITETLAK